MTTPEPTWLNSGSKNERHCVHPNRLTIFIILPIACASEPLCHRNSKTPIL